MTKENRDYFGQKSRCHDKLNEVKLRPKSRKSRYIRDKKSEIAAKDNLFAVLN